MANCCDYTTLRMIFQLLSHVQFFVTLWTAACQAFLSITNSRSLLKLMSIESVMPSNHLILCCPLFLLPSIFPSIKVFSSESVLHIWPVNIVRDVTSITISQKQPALKHYFSDVSVYSQRCFSSSEVCFQSFVAQ